MYLEILANICAQGWFGCRALAGVTDAYFSGCYGTTECILVRESTTGLTKNCRS